MAGKRTQDSSAQIPDGEARDVLNGDPNKNVRELQLLAHFYHKHGYSKEAEEIRQPIVDMHRQHLGREKVKQLKVEEDGR
jgi:hypothetical protein